MSTERNLELARRWFGELWSKPDLDVADIIVDPDYAPDWIHIDAKGPEQVKHEIRYFRSIYPDLRYEIVDVVPTDDRVWVRYNSSFAYSQSTFRICHTLHMVVSRKFTTICGIVSQVAWVLPNCWGGLTSHFEAIPNRGLTITCLWTAKSRICPQE